MYKGVRVFVKVKKKDAFLWLHRDDLPHVSNPGLWDSPGGRIEDFCVYFVIRFLYQPLFFVALFCQERMHGVSPVEQLLSPLLPSTL